MDAPFAPQEGLRTPAEECVRSRPSQRWTGDAVKQDWKKLIVTTEESDRMLAQLKAGECICEELDEKPGDVSRHPLNRLHHEQLQAQRPRGPRLTGPSDAPHMRVKPLLEEERFRKKSRQYAYKVMYTCSKCGSEWEVVHDYWWTAGSSEAVTGFEGGPDDCLIERFLCRRTLAGGMF